MGNSQKFSNQIEPFLLKSKGQMTASDAAALCGITIEQGKQALSELSLKYHCKLKITENGDLIYDFQNFILRGQRTWREFLEIVVDKLWRFFTFVYKGCIALVLVVYFGIFFAIFIVLIFSSNNDKKNNKSGSFDLIFVLLRSIFLFNQVSREKIVLDQQGYRYRVPDKPKKNFINSVFDFVFGPERVKPALFHQEQEFAAYLKENKGIATISDVVAISGMSREKASDFFAYTLGNYEAEAKINEEDGVLYGNFSNLLRTASDVKSQTEVVYYWDEFEAPYELNGNTATVNMIILCMNLFNLFSAIIFISIAKNEFELGLILGIIPAVFSVVFFLIPAIRWMRIGILNAKQERNNIRRILIKTIMSNPSSKLTKQQFVAFAYKNNKAPEQAEEVFDELAIELEAATEASEIGLVYHFETIDRELNFSKNFRASYTPNSNLGKVEMEGL